MFRQRSKNAQVMHDDFQMEGKDMARTTHRIDKVLRRHLLTTATTLGVPRIAIAETISHQFFLVAGRPPPAAGARARHLMIPLNWEIGSHPAAAFVGQLPTPALPRYRLVRDGRSDIGAAVSLGRATTGCV